MKLLKTIFILLVIVIASIAVRNSVVLKQQPFGSPLTSRQNSISGTPSYYEDDIYVTSYATTSIIARNVTSSDMVRFIQNVGNVPATLWLFADATTTQPTYAGGFRRLTTITATGTLTSLIDLSWFRGSIYVVTEVDPTYLKVVTYP